MIGMPNLKKRGLENGSNGHAAPAAPSYDVAALEALVQRAEGAAAALRALDERAAAVTALEDRVTRLAAQLAGADAVGKQLSTMQEQATRLSSAQERSQSQLASANADVERVRGACGTLISKVDAALELRDQLEIGRAHV